MIGLLVVQLDGVQDGSNNQKCAPPHPHEIHNEVLGLIDYHRLPEPIFLYFFVAIMFIILNT